jgi:serine kinase of HPr protein (carbohydrate metabolism regulator)
MRLRDLVEELGLEVVTGSERLENEVVRGYASDLMSDVLANSQKGDLWVTLQIHLNIVAVASMKELAGIILINGRRPEKETEEHARQEKIPILVSRLPAFELIGRLHRLGVSGMSNA